MAHERRIRLRRSANGHVAINVDSKYGEPTNFWHVIYLDGIACRTRDDFEIVGKEWSELIIMEHDLIKRDGDENTEV